MGYNDVCLSLELSVVCLGWSTTYPSNQIGALHSIYIREITFWTRTDRDFTDRCPDLTQMDVVPPAPIPQWMKLRVENVRMLCKLCCVGGSLNANEVPLSGVCNRRNLPSTSPII